jgi:hypothetical protein
MLTEFSRRDLFSRFGGGLHGAALVSLLGWSFQRAKVSAARTSWLRARRISQQRQSR